MLGQLEEGLRWRVRDGGKIRIWGHKWQLTPTSFRVQTPAKHLMGDSKVKKLFKNNSIEWDEGRVQEIF